MNDEDFERDLRRAVREIAPAEAPISLRHRVESVIGESTAGQPRWSATVGRTAVGLAMVGGLVVLAFAVTSPPRRTPSASPNGSAATQSATPSSRLTQSPSPANSPANTPAPTAAGRVASVVARVPLPHRQPQTPFADKVAVSDGAIWVALDSRPFSLVRIDTAINKVTSNVPIVPPSLFTGEGALWLLSPVGGAPTPDRITISRVNLITGAVREVASRPYGNAGAAGLGALWLFSGPNLEKLDPGTLAVRATFPAVGYGSVLQVACGALWTWEPAGPGFETLDRLDPATGRVVEQIRMGDDARGQVFDALGSCWTQSGGMLLRIQPGSGVVARVPAGRNGSVQIAGDTFWTWDPDGTIQQVDPATGREAGPSWKLPPQDLFVDPKGSPDWRLLSAGGSLWLVTGAEVVRLDISTSVARH